LQSQIFAELLWDPGSFSYPGTQLSVADSLKNLPETQQLIAALLYRWGLRRKDIDTRHKNSRRFIVFSKGPAKVDHDSREISKAVGLVSTPREGHRVTIAG